MLAVEANDGLELVQNPGLLRSGADRVPSCQRAVTSSSRAAVLIFLIPVLLNGNSRGEHFR